MVSLTRCWHFLPTRAVSASWRCLARISYSWRDMAIASRLVPTWRTLDDAARQTGISRRTLTRWVSEHKLRAYSRAGDRRRYVDLDDLHKLQQLRPIDEKS